VKHVQRGYLRVNTELLRQVTEDTADLVFLTQDVDAAKARMDEAFAIYPNLPSYKAMLDKEGARTAADIGFIGDEETVAAAITKLADAGATDFVAAIVGDAAERERGFALVSELARS